MITSLQQKRSQFQFSDPPCRRYATRLDDVHAVRYKSSYNQIDQLVLRTSRYVTASLPHQSFVLQDHKAYWMLLSLQSSILGFDIV